MDDHPERPEGWCAKNRGTNIFKDLVEESKRRRLGKRMGEYDEPGAVAGAKTWEGGSWDCGICIDPRGEEGKTARGSWEARALFS